MTSPKKISERAWISDAMEQYQAPLFSYATRLLKSRERAQDIVQDTFLRLCAQPREKVQENLGAWLYRVCRNCALDAIRKGQRMKPLSTEVERNLASPGPSPARRYETGEQLETALDLLGRLPDNQQEVIRLKLEHGLSYREIADVTDLSVSNVGFLMHTGLKSIRRRMACRSQARPAEIRRIK